MPRKNTTSRHETTPQRLDRYDHDGEVTQEAAFAAWIRTSLVGVALGLAFAKYAQGAAGYSFAWAALTILAPGGWTGWPA